jgi:hypothetical protein
MSVSRTSNKSECIEPIELIIDVKFTNMQSGPPGCNGYEGQRYSVYFKISTNGNVIITMNSGGTVDNELLRVNDNIPIPQFLVNVIRSVLWQNVKYNTSSASGQAPALYGGGCTYDLYLSHLFKMVQIVDLIKSAWKSEKMVQESMIKIRDSAVKRLQKSINELQESNKNLAEENIIIANKNEIYEKQINELQESNKNLSEEYLILFNKNEIYEKHLNELQESNKNLAEENIIIANKNEIYKKQINELQESNKNLSEEYLILFNKNEIYEKHLNELQESNKNLSEENIIIANKNDIYKKHLNELQESVKKLYKLLFFLLLTLSVVPLICLRYFCE